MGALTIERPADGAGGRWSWRCSRRRSSLSAGLVFMVQPMFARFALPLLGGAPAVWTTAMLFFQTVLLLAYLYAHWSTPGSARGARPRCTWRSSPRRCSCCRSACPTAGRRPADGLAGAVAAADDARGRRPAVLRGVVDRAAAPELARGHRPPGCPRPVLPVPRQQHRQRGRPAELPAAGGAAASRSTARAGCGRPATAPCCCCWSAARVVLWRSGAGRDAEPEQEQAAAAADRAGAAAALGGARLRPVEPDAGRDGRRSRPTWRRSRSCGCCRWRSTSRRSSWSSRAARAAGPSIASRLRLAPQPSSSPAA